LKNEPDSVTLGDGTKVYVRATVKFISFSAHSDYAQTSEYIGRLKPNVVVLVHGEEHGMGRMRTKLQEDFPDLTVTAPQNCQTVALKVPPDRSADAVGEIAETLSDSKRRRPEVSGLLVEDTTGSRILVSPEELSSYTTLSACKVEQCAKFTFPHTLAVLGRALREVYDDVVVVDGTLSVCDCVEVSLCSQLLSVKWETSPIADLVADSVSFTAVELMRSPMSPQPFTGSVEDAEAREARLFKVLCTFLQQEFGNLTIDDAAQSVSIEVDGSRVVVNFGDRSVDSENAALKERVRLCLARCETSLRPLAPF
jgi:cleavage and polyadenylation specificity factor subunit 3